MNDVFPFIVLIAGLLGAGLLIYIIKKPESGFLLLAIMAPVSNQISIGPVKGVYLIGGCVLAGTLFKSSRIKGSHFPKFVVAYGGLVLGWSAYAWVAGLFAGLQVFIGLAGSVLIVCAAFLLYREVSQLERWLWVFAVAVAISDVVIAGLLVTYPALRPVLFDISSEGVRLQGALGNPNMFGGAQLLAFSVFAYFALKDGERYWLMSGLGGAVVFLALLGTQSRSAILGLFFGVGVVGFFAVRASRRPFATTAAICLSGILMVMTFLNLPEEVAGFRLGRVGDTGGARVYDVRADNVVADRFYIYQASLETIWKNPFGVGFIDTQELATVIGRDSEKGISKPTHNFVLNHLLKYGVIGGATMVFIWLLPPIVIVWKLWRRRLPVRSLSTFMLIGVVGYLIHNLFHSMTNWIYFWIFWGMCIRAAQLEDRRRTGR